MGRPHLGRNQLRTVDIVFLIIAAAAPLGAIVGALPYAVSLGNGNGAPGTYLYAVLALFCFAAGYAAMSRKVTNAGAFYAYIAKGIGRPLGVGSGYVALVSYTAVTVGVAALLGVLAESIIENQFGIDWPWYVWSGLALGITAFLGYREISINARLLGAVLILEVLVLLAMNIGVIASKGLSMFSFEPFTPAAIFSGAPGIAFLFAFNSFIGYEASAIFGEESRDPKRTVARATYWAIGSAGSFFVLTAWCIITYYSGADVQAVAAEDPAAFIFDIVANTVSAPAASLMQVLLVMSLLASLLGIHNAASRYFFALGREGLLPRAFASSHPKHESPWVGSLTVTALTVGAVAVAAVSGSDPYLGLAGCMLAVGTLGIVGLQAATSVSAFVYFRRSGEPTKLWSTVIGPVVGAIGLSAAVYLGLNNFPLLTGTETGWQNYLPWALGAALVIGIGFGYWLKKAQPDLYAGIGGDEVPKDEVQVGRQPAESE
ncbi:hypothetical protein A5727_16865 [Mycobacterium sp. ACS4331]|nr:hypothetical protein A5727_16865 [Mycobacterium sp. ACS4331]